MQVGGKYVTFVVNTMTYTASGCENFWLTRQLIFLREEQVDLNVHMVKINVKVTSLPLFLESESYV